MADATPRSAGWTVRPVPPLPRSITALIRDSTLDAELAATIWLLIDARVPVIVAGKDQASDARTVLDALAALLPTELATIELAGADETFDWLPEARELGWHGPTPSVTAPPGDVLIGPASTVLLIPEVSDRFPSSTWGRHARVAIRAASLGYGLLATIAGDSLEDVLDTLRRPPIGADDDELSRLGVVLIVRRTAGSGRPLRVAAAHYVRPVARDEHGHVQRLGPAVLATWDPTSDRLDHFGWGVTPELALRVGRRAGDFELEVDRLRDLLNSLVAAGVVEPDAVQAAIAAARATSRVPGIS